MWYDKETWLTYKQKLFANAYIANNWNWTQSALLTYNTTDNNTARNIASTNLAKPNIKAYLADKWHIAGNVIMTLMQDEKVNPSVRIDWAKYVYDQVYGKASQKVEHNHTWTVSLAHLYHSLDKTSLKWKSVTQTSQSMDIIDASTEDYKDE